MYASEIAKKRNLNKFLVDRFTVRQYASDPKRDRYHEDRINEIERENRLLFERLTGIKKGNDFYELQQDFTSNLRRFRSNLKKHNPFGLPQEKAKELKTIIAKERKKFAAAELSENLPAIVQKVTSTLINLGNIQYDQADRTLTPQQVSEKDSFNSVPQNQSFEEKREIVPVYDKKGVNVTLDGGRVRPPRHEKRSHSTGRRGKKNVTIQNKENSYFLSKGVTGRTHKHFDNQDSSLSDYDPTESRRIIHKKVYKIQGEVYLIEVSKFEGFMVIMAINNSSNTAAMKKVYDDQLVNFLTEFNYDFELMCIHLKIKGDQIQIVSPDKDEQPGVRLASHQSSKPGYGRSHRSFEEQLNNEFQINTSKKRFVDKDRIEKLAKPKLTIAQALGVSEVNNIRPGASVYQYVPSLVQQRQSQPLAEKQRSKSQPRNQQSVVEYSSYGRKANDMQMGREGYPPPLPWTNEYAPKIIKHHHESEAQESLEQNPPESMTIDREPRLKIHPKPLPSPSINPAKHNDVQVYWDQRSEAVANMYETDYPTRFQLTSKPIPQNIMPLPSESEIDYPSVQPVERKKFIAEESVRKSQPDLPWEDNTSLAFGYPAEDKSLSHLHQSSKVDLVSNKKSSFQTREIPVPHNEAQRAQNANKKAPDYSRDIPKYSKDRGTITTNASAEEICEEDTENIAETLGARNNGRLIAQNYENLSLQDPKGKDKGYPSSNYVKDDAVATTIQEETQDNYITIFDDSEGDDEPTKEPVVEHKPITNPKPTITRKEYINPFKTATPTIKKDSPTFQAKLGLGLKEDVDKQFHKAFTPDFTNDKDTPVHKNRLDNRYLNNSNRETVEINNGREDSKFMDREHLKLPFQQSQMSLRGIAKESNRYSTFEEPGDDKSTKKMISDANPHDETKENDKPLELTLGYNLSEDKKQSSAFRINHTPNNNNKDYPFDSKPLVLRSVEKKTPSKQIKEPKETSEKLILLPPLQDVNKQGLEVTLAKVHQNLHIDENKLEGAKISYQKPSDECEVEEIDLP